MAGHIIGLGTHVCHLLVAPELVSSLLLVSSAWMTGDAQQQYPTGTILVDLEQHRPVEILLGSNEEILTQWLDGHAGVEVIVRDRGAGYRKAARHRRTACSNRVLDRWHLLKNLGEVIQKTLGQQIEVLRQAAGKPGEKGRSRDVLDSNGAAPNWWKAPEASTAQALSS